jgi:hypothetical protein
MATRLDAAASANATTLAYSISAGTNRRLIINVGSEGTQAGNHTCTYGDQTATFIGAAIAGSGATQQTVTKFELTEAQIAAAVGTTITAGNVPTDFNISARSYQDCEQTTPLTNFDTDSTGAATPNPLAALDITPVGDNAIIVAFSGVGNATTATWAAPLTEQTDQATASAAGSMADMEQVTAALVACEPTWASQNRAAGVAVAIEDLAAVTREQDSFRYYDNGTESGSSAHELQNVDLTIGTLDIFHTRVGSQMIGNPPAETCTLQHKENGDAATEWRDV